jgi:hypothetical protein
MKNKSSQKIKLIIISTIFLILFSLVSYKFMLGFQETNEISLTFNVIDSNDLKDLRVNLYVIRADGPSEWYGYYKYVTVIDKGNVLTNFKSKYVMAYEIKSMSKLNNLYFTTELLDNVFARKEDYKINYTFEKNFISTSEDPIIHFNKNKVNRKYSKIENISDLKYFDPNATKYQITDISEENLLFLQTKTFDELKNVSKIKSEDILKLKQLTYNEKINLVKIHNTKRFEKPLD